MGKSVPDGPSTSAEPNRTARKPRRLTRPEFEARLFARVRGRYSLQLDEAWLHDLIKDALVPGADGREANDRLSPVYTYGFQSYRRAVQVARLRRDGFVERDAIRIQLFLRGYGERDIRQALWNQYFKYGKSLVAQVRSGYADNWKRVPDGQRSSLMKNMGPLDPRFVTAGFQLNDHKYIDFFRAAKQNDLIDPIKMPSLANVQHELVKNGELNFDTLLDYFGDIISGALMFTDIGDRSTKGLVPIEEIITQSTADQYQTAREFFLFMTSMCGAQILSGLEIGHDAEARQDALKALRYSVRGDPRWATSLLVQGLMFVRMFGTDFNVNDIWSVVRYFKDNNLSVSDLIRSLQSQTSDKT